MIRFLAFGISVCCAYFVANFSAAREYRAGDRVEECGEAIRLDPKDAEAYCNRGTAFRDKQDYDRAIADFNEAIRLDPKYVNAFHNRGNTWKAKREYDRAVKDYDEVIRLNPKSLFGYYDRGNTWKAKHEYDRAIADFDEVIRLVPTFAAAYFDRGNTWKAKREYDRAVKDYDEAIRLNPTYASAFYNRGVTRFILRKSEGVADLRRSIELKNWSADSHYSALWAVALSRLQGDAETADALLAEADGKLKSEWPNPCLDLFRGKLTEQALLALATDNDKATEARCYLALDHLVKRRIDEARRHFTWVVDNGNKTFYEYEIAVAELKRLDAAEKATGK